jgi:hypothetical protein
MVKKSNQIEISDCYKKSIKKYNNCVKKTKCNKKRCEQRCWNKGEKTYKKCKKKKKGGSNTSGALLQLNSNSTIYNFPIFYFPYAMENSNQMNNGNNNTSYSWEKWYQNYINNNDPNSNFGSLTIEQSMR